MTKFTTYQAALSPAEAAAGMNAALRNARRLVADAECLLSAGRWSTAASVAVLSIEEAGKITVLRQLCLSSDPSALKSAWRDYRSHRSKLKKPIGVNPDCRPLKDPGVADTLVQQHADLAARVDLFKQSGFYTDCIPDQQGRPVWTTPDSQIIEHQARELVDIAATITPKTDVLVRDIELMVKHLGPVFGTAAMVKGWQDYFAAMEAEGLLTRAREDIEGQVFDSVLGVNWKA